MDTRYNCSNDLSVRIVGGFLCAERYVAPHRFTRPVSIIRAQRAADGEQVPASAAAKKSAPAARPEASGPVRVARRTVKAREALAPGAPVPAAPAASIGQVIPKTVDAAYLMVCFRADWPALAGRIATRDQLMALVSVSPAVRDWYLALKADTATVSSLPDSMQRGGVTPEMWEDVQTSLEASRALERSISAETAAAAAAFSSTINSLAIRKRQSYAAMSPLVEIARISVEQLPLGDQVDIALADETVRASITAERVARSQEALTRAFMLGNYVSPFR